MPYSMFKLTLIHILFKHHPALYRGKKREKNILSKQTTVYVDDFNIVDT